MDSWESSLRPSRHRPITGNNPTTTSHHPSFSSSLLDAIYRSIDEGEDRAIVGATKEEELAVYKEKLAARRSAAEEKLVRRSADYDAFHRRRTPAASSSSGSSYGGLSSSSESESACYRARPAADKAPPAKTLMAPLAHRRDEKASAARKAKKQSVSPGARIAGFLNSLLGSAKTAKKAKLSSAPPNAADSPSPSPSPASSRSCLSKSGGGSGKRSVRFYPVSVIVDEDCRPCGQKSLYDPSPATTRYLSEELKVHIMEKNKRVEEAADRILNRYHTRTEILLRRESWAVPPAATAVVEEEDDDDDCDAASDASSDLFELENLGVIGGERYREELPVYETTNVVTNRAIAHGLIL